MTSAVQKTQKYNEEHQMRFLGKFSTEVTVVQTLGKWADKPGEFRRSTWHSEAAESAEVLKGDCQTRRPV